MDEGLLAESLLHAFPSALLVFDAEGKALKHNEQWEQLAANLDLAGSFASFETLSAATGLGPLSPSESERVQELLRNGKTVLVRQRALSVDRVDCTALLIDDITRYRETMRSVTHNTLSALWKIRSRATGIQNALSLLAEYSSKNLSEDDQSLLRDSLFETWQLARYCNNLRDISGLESGVIEIALEPCYLKQAVDSAVGNVMIYASHQQKVCNIRTSVPNLLQVNCDWNRLVHILDSIVLNSVLYATAEVSIDITALCESGQVVLSIKDNGMGIEEDELATVFAQGFRGANATSVAYNGMGIELYLARQMLIRMNGAIDLYSGKGTGTTVEVVLEEAKQ